VADKVSEKETIIGPHTRIAGEMRGDEDVIVQGRVEGRVVLNSIFTIEESAIVQADVEARVVLVSGILVGNVSASEHIRLAEKARVVGNLTAPRVVMEDGATYRGRLDMGAGAEADEHLRSSRQASDGASSRVQPPRMTVPARVAASSGSTVAAPKMPPAAPPPRLAAAIPPPDAEPPPSLPSAEEAAAGGVASPAGWAKKKLNRRS
jgi:cytoskeletal protein CcmA (bactofilin family)